MIEIERDSKLVRNLDEKFGLRPEIRRDLARSVEPVRLKKGDFAFKKFDLCTSFLFLGDGIIRSFAIDAKGDEITYFLFFAAAFVGDLSSVVTRKPSRFCFEAIEDCEAERISLARLSALLNRYPELQALVRAVTEEAYVRLERRTESLLFLSAPQRYAEFIAEFEDRSQRIPQYVIASYLGVRPESLSRIRSKRAKNLRKLT